MRTFLRLLTLVALAGTLSAQNPAPSEVPDCFAGSNPDPLQSGQTLQVHFEHPQLANKTVTVVARDLVFPERRSTFSIPLDANGKGTKDFTPPTNWGGVVLMHPESQDHAIPIQ
jgi:hypothetical protein